MARKLSEMEIFDSMPAEVRTYLNYGRMNFVLRSMPRSYWTGKGKENTWGIMRFLKQQMNDPENWKRWMDN